MFQFIHAADLHLDSPLHGLDHYEGAPVEAIRHAPRRALENLVQLAIDKEVAFVIIAGDVYDGDWRDYQTGLYFVNQMARLGEAGIKVYLISGNHDAESEMTKSLPIPANVHRFPTDSAETVFHEATGAAIHGQGFAEKAVRTDLSLEYPDAVSGRFNIGVLHTCANGIDGHDPYAPCTVEGLANLGYDYWALGHIHKRQFLSEAAPIIAFSGNIQGRHIRETGPKGCLLVTVEQDRPVAEFQALDVFRWEHCEVDAGDCETNDDVAASVIERIRTEIDNTDGRPLATRITVTGSSTAHETLVLERDHFEQELRARVIDEARDRVWIEKVRIATRPIRQNTLAIGEGPLAELQNLMDGLDDNPDVQEFLAEEIANFSKQLPPDIRRAVLEEIDGAGSLEDPRWLAPIARQAGEELQARLIED